MKVVSIVGARPQLIKAAELSRELRKEHTEILVHTGQHYDVNMSDVFFEELKIPAPEYNLGIGSGTHGKQTGEMLAAIEQVLITEKPDWVLVYGDTNSTLAGALASVKLHIRVAHVEAGLRSFNRMMPEEINRILTDHVSSLLLCPTQTAMDNLKNEGIFKGVHIVGDLMYDALVRAVSQGERTSTIQDRLELEPKHYFLATIHRAENTDDPQRLQNILDAFNRLDQIIIWPIHPRTRKILEKFHWEPSNHIRIIDPVGYYDMAILEKNAKVILTDSGGMQKEAYWLGVPCITLRDETEWIETVTSGWNTLTGANAESIIDQIEIAFSLKEREPILANRFDVKKTIRLMASSL